jgi:hypothetical protein
MVRLSLNQTNYPDHFLDLLEFLCKKYSIDRTKLFVEYSSRPPPLLRGGRRGYYDGLLSFRDNNGHPEFLITVFRVARNPLLTLAHEFTHLVRDLKSGDFHKYLGPPDDPAEEALDKQALFDLEEFEAAQRLKPTSRSPRSSEEA